MVEYRNIERGQPKTIRPFQENVGRPEFRLATQRNVSQDLDTFYLSFNKTHYSNADEAWIMITEVVKPYSDKVKKRKRFTA